MITAHGIVTLMASLVDDLSAGTCRAMDRHVVSLVYGHMSYTCGVFNTQPRQKYSGPYSCSPVHVRGWMT